MEQPITANGSVQYVPQIAIFTEGCFLMISVAAATFNSASINNGVTFFK